MLIYLTQVIIAKTAILQLFWTIDRAKSYTLGKVYKHLPFRAWVEVRQLTARKGRLLA